VNDAQRAFLVKIIPPRGNAVYRLRLTPRHLIALGAALGALVLSALGYHVLRMHNAEANVRTLESLTASQQAQLRLIDRQADALGNQLRSVERENAEIKRLLGADHGKRAEHAFVVPRVRTNAAGFRAVQARLARLAQASAATRDDSRALRRLAMRVLNLRRLEQIERVRMLAAIPSINPVGGAIAAGFGWRTFPWPEFHKGIDLTADWGSPVRATADGTVVSAGWDGGFGIKVDIDHGNGYHTWYAHLSRTTVSPGEHVAKGQEIALSGSTGEATGPHLHYQLMYQGQPIDPEPFLNGVPERVLATLPGSSHV
jgi:murein DD-endopeptidase MepM/ murein hydrolase activator NlpD